MSTGPITLFDKSFIQSLSIDESVWFDQFYYSVVCPIFFAETLADLSKKMPEGRSPEKEVAKIADKFPDMGGNPCMNHSDLVLANLMGNDIAMDGRILMPGGQPVRSGGKSGFVFESPQEADAFNRWQRGEFREVEARYAQNWRKSVSNLDLKRMADIFKKMGIHSRKCKSLEDARNHAKEIVREPKAYDQMALAVLFLNVPHEHQQRIVRNWQIQGLKPIGVYAPYAAFVLEIELFFQIGISSGLISTERPSNRIDISYLFYLPFCMIFVSSDKLHRRSAPLFMRENQEFVWGEDLKVDLAALDNRYSNLPKETKDIGVLSFASSPPQEDKFLTTELWDRHMSVKWRKQPETKDKLPDTNKDLLKDLNSFVESKPLSPEDVNFDNESVDVMSVQRRIRRQKGKWLQVPKDLKDDRPNKKFDRDAPISMEIQDPDLKDDKSPAINMLSIDDELIIFKSNGIYRVLTAETLDPDAQHLDTKHTYEKLFSVGASSPYVARIILQFKETLELVIESSVSKTEIISFIWNANKLLLNCYSITSNISDQIQKLYIECNQVIERSKNQETIPPLPKVKNLENNVRSFLNESKLFLIEAFKLLNIFFDMPVSDKSAAHFDKHIQWIESNLGDSHEITKLFKKDIDWIRMLSEQRNALEHPGDGQQLYIENFKLQPGNKFSQPSWSYDLTKKLGLKSDYTDLVHDLEIYANNMFLFFEELILRITFEKLKNNKMLDLYSIEDESINKDCPILYRVGLKQKQ